MIAVYRIYAILESSKNAISEEEMSLRMNNVDKGTRVRALNVLIGENKIRLVRQNNKILYEIVVEEKNSEEIVADVIKEAGKNGIWIRDIRFKTKLSQIVLNKTLKILENKKIIRSIKSISNRKLYVLFDFEPDESITGGACYEAGFIKEDIVKNLKSACFQFLYDLFKESYDEAMTNIHSPDEQTISFDKIHAAAPMVFANFKNRNIFLDIKLEDIQQILNILVYECKLLKMEVGGKTLYRYNPYNRDKTDMFYAPCMVCHVYDDCKPGSVNISPEKCQYLSIDKF